MQSVNSAHPQLWNRTDAVVVHPVSLPFSAPQEQLSLQLDATSSKVTQLECKLKDAKADVEKADQLNSDLRGQMMDKELEIQSLQVFTELYETYHVCAGRKGPA